MGSSSSSSDSKGKRKRGGSEQKSAGADPVDVSDTDTPASKPEENPAIEKAKSEALREVVKLKDADITPDERRRQWRALLRAWHPDKYKDKEVATAVFQFLQKAKSMLNMDVK